MLSPDPVLAAEVSTAARSITQGDVAEDTIAPPNPATVEALMYFHYTPSFLSC